MEKAKVAVNGYGTIGKRVADAVKKMRDLELVGVAKYSFDYSAISAYMAGIPIFTLPEMIPVFESQGIKVNGSIKELIEIADIVVDASPAGQGSKNKDSYLKKNKKAIFQGGEKPDVAQLSFNAYCNYPEALGKDYVRVVSCNTTGLLRPIATLDQSIGIESVNAVIVRRACDPKEEKGILNAIKLDPASIPSHHAEDVKTVLPSLKISTLAIIAPTTLMHAQIIFIKFRRNVSRDEIIDILSSKRRIKLIDAKATGLDSTSKIIEHARDIGRKRYDIYENIIWRDMIRTEGNEATIVQAIHQEAIVIPENIDTIRAMLRICESAEESIELTDKNLGIGNL